MIRSADQECVIVDLEEEVARLRQEKEQLSQELAGVLEAGRRAGEELSRRDQELSGNTRCPRYLPLIALFDMLKLTSFSICSAQSEHQEAPGRAGQGSGLLEG